MKKSHTSITVILLLLVLVLILLVPSWPQIESIIDRITAYFPFWLPSHHYLH